jgi:glycosyltransferase involved in cell wall biosynthesis
VPESSVAAPSRFDPTPPSPIVAWIGRLDALKDWKACIRIVGRLSATLPAPELWIVGEPQGAEGDRRLYEYARRQGVLRNMRWYPSFPHDRMPRLLDAVRDSGGVVLSTSREESFGMSVAEAMARECAVVVPSSGPFPEFVEHGVTGRLYRPGDVRQAAREIAFLLLDADARRACGHLAREVILARHAPDVALRQLADVLQGVVADSPGAVG